MRKALLLTLLLTTTLAHAEAERVHARKARIRLLPIGLFLGGAFISRTGTLDQVDVLAGAGFALAVAGLIMTYDGGLIDDDVVVLDARDVYPQMLAEARTTARHPDLTLERAIGFASREFEVSPGLSPTEKNLVFAKVMLAVDAKAKELRVTGERVELSQAAREVLGDLDSPKNREITKRLFLLAGVPQEG